MSLNVIDKYVTKKEKDLLEYARILESIITLEENKMWQNKKEFSNYAKEIIDLYASKYYFENNLHRDNPIEYSNDNINFVLKAIIEYCKKNEMMKMIKEWKNETFLLSVIICTSCYVDIATNLIDGNFQDTKSKFKYLLSYLRKTKILRISDNKYWINDLFDAIKKNTNEDHKFFDCFKDNNAYNEYYVFNENPLYYKFNFKYSIAGLENSDPNLVAKTSKNYASKFLEMSYELLSIHILEELISNRKMGIYLIEINEILNKKNNLAKIFDSKYLKNYLRLLVPFDKEGSYLNLIKSFTDMGINIIYNYDNIGNISDSIFRSNIELFVSNEFLQNNIENQSKWAKNNVKFIVKNEED